MEARRTIPRMRTIAKAVAELKKLDPGTSVTEHCIRQLVQLDEIPVVWAGSKALVNLDDLLALFLAGTNRMEPELEVVGEIRPLPERLVGKKTRTRGPGEQLDDCSIQKNGSGALPIHQRIKEYLVSKGIKQSFVAKRCGWSKQKTSLLLNGKTKMPVEEFFLICDAIGVSYDFFVKERGENE